MHAISVAFCAAKEGNESWEWEDGVASSPGNPLAGHRPRFAVADGATGGFGAARWSAQLVAGFIGLGESVAPSALEPSAMRRWLAELQGEWLHDPRAAGASDMERLKMVRTGSFATLLGCELSGLDGHGARWDAIAVGDTVLFHVRDQQVVKQFPEIAAESFGYNPAGLSTRPDALADMVGELTVAGGELVAGDRLFVATDALAHWMIEANRYSPKDLWATLIRLDHPAGFERFVADRRRLDGMANDDVTLLRVHLSARWPADLVVCL